MASHTGLTRRNELTLHAERVLLRPFRQADLDTFIAYRSDPNVARYQGWDAPYSRSRGLSFIAEMRRTRPGTPGRWYQLAIERQSDQQMIGDCGFCILEKDGQQAEIGFTLARSHHGEGYATEAVTRLLAYLFDELHLHRVVANCDVENVPSARLLERLGMRREAHFIENVWFKRRWGSEYWYALLRREWQDRS